MFMKVCATTILQLSCLLAWLQRWGHHLLRSRRARWPKQAENHNRVGGSLTVRHDTLGRRGDRKIHQLSSKYTTAPKLEKKIKKNMLGWGNGHFPFTKIYEKRWGLTERNAGLAFGRQKRPFLPLFFTRPHMFTQLLFLEWCKKMPTNRDFEISPAKWEASMHLRHIWPRLPVRNWPQPSKIWCTALAEHFTFERTKEEVVFDCKKKENCWTEATSNNVKQHETRWNTVKQREKNQTSKKITNRLWIDK